MAYQFGPRTDDTCKKLLEKVDISKISTIYTDDWGAYQRLIPLNKHVIGKQNTQAIERNNLTLRTRIKRLVRKTICFSKLTDVHDAVIGTFIERECYQPF